jgi:CBS domain-containing protein
VSAVSEIMSTRGTITLRANFTPTVLDAIKLMIKNKVGSVVIAGSNGKPEGIVTERDILRMAAKSKRQPEDVSVGEIMSAPVITVRAYDSVDAAAVKMTKNKIKHLVVVEDDGTLAGIISVTDIAKKLSKIIADDYVRYHSLGSAISMK